MKWALGFLVLLAVGAALRRLLRLDAQATRPAGGLVPLDPEQEVLYHPVALEVETQSTILGISLNDAIEERDCGHAEIAWRLVRLSASEWDRLAELVTVLLTALAKHLPRARAVAPAHGMAAHRFKSGAMIRSFRMHELLDELAFRSKFRFQLHLYGLRRASEILTAEFRRTYRYGERTGDRSAELWDRLDPYFHDFDLIAKETLLAFRAILACLPDSSLDTLCADLKDIVGRGVRSTSIPAER